MTGPREVNSEIQQFQSQLNRNLPVAKQFCGQFWKRKKYSHAVTFQAGNCL